jgi:LacI family transcriptional regulator
MSQTDKVKKPTLKTVAKSAGVSPSTVSLVLQNKGSIPEVTRARVKAAIETTGYQRTVRRRGSGDKLVAVIADDIENPYYAELYSAIDAELMKDGYLTMMVSSNGSEKRQCVLLEGLAQMNVSGAIVIPANGSGKATLDLIGELDFPVVFGVRHLGFGTFDYVGPNYFLGMQIATQHLLDLGHRTIAFVGGEDENSAYAERIGGFRMAISSNTNANLKTFEIQGPPTSQFGVQVFEQLQELDPKPTAIIAYNDLLAFGLVSGAGQHGLRPGQDISIVGFDDVRASALRNIPLTTISTPPLRIGQELARLLNTRVEDPNQDAVNIIPPPVLKIRKTSGPASS